MSNISGSASPEHGSTNGYYATISPTCGGATATQDFQQAINLSLVSATKLPTMSKSEPISTVSLPSGDSPDLHLDHPTPTEQTQIWIQYASIWGKALPVSQYLEECEHMLHTPLTQDGGMTSWILVDRNGPPNQRSILSCCRTIRKKAVISEQDGSSRNGVVHGVSAVFCEPKYRGRGYARRMMIELRMKLKNWQISDGERCVGSILYSDIGIKFYSAVGWIPALSNVHLEFPAEVHPMLAGTVPLRASDLEALCKEDEIKLRKEIAKPSDKTRLALLADEEHMHWHHAKEEFIFTKIFNRKPEQKGVAVGEQGKRVWAIWSHRLYSSPLENPASNTLYILRLVVENDCDHLATEDQMGIKRNLEAVIRSAQTEAAIWKLGKVKLWNPSPLVEKLIEWAGVRYERVNRANSSIASLLWYGRHDLQSEIEWVANEKYAWC